MNRHFRFFALILALAASSCGWNNATTVPAGDGALSAGLGLTRIDGTADSLGAWRGKTLLLVNTASECGFTGQYEGLQELQRRYASRGFSVLGFPCNDFMGQEPGSDKQILEFCQGRFQVDFPLYSKLHVGGDSIHPLYSALTTQSPESLRGAIKWNFTKFLVDPAGKVVGRFEPKVEPLDPLLVNAVESALPRP